jgi:HK97 family phage major capsid protein
MSNQIAAWQRKQADAVREAQTLNAQRGDRDLTDAEQQRYDELTREIDRLQSALEAEQRLELRRVASVAAGQDGAPVDTPKIGMADKELSQYSLLRALHASARNRPDLAPLEMEASRATAQKLGRDPQGFFLPYDWLRSEYSGGQQQRAVTTTTMASLIPTSKVGFIDLLRNRMVVRAAGAMVLDGLIGNVDLPRRTAGAALSWIAAGAPPSESSNTFDHVQLRAKTGSVWMDIRRNVFNQTSMDMEMLVLEDLAASVQLGIDYAALHADGSSNAPTGLASTSGIGMVYAGGAATSGVNANGAALTWADVVKLETEVAIDNADIGRLGYLTNAKVRGKMKATPKVSSTDSRMLWDVDGMINGYAPWVSNQVRGDITKGSASDLSAMFFGNWADLVIAFWGVIDITTDIPDNRTGDVRVAAIVETDIAVRRAQSFAACLDIDTD